MRRTKVSAAVNSVALLKTIAADQSAPESARVAATRALVAISEGENPPALSAAKAKVSRRALLLLGKG